MSLVDAVVTGFTFACFSSIMQYFVNRLIVRPFDRRWNDFETWARETLKKISKNSSESEIEDEKKQSVVLSRR